MKKLLIIVLFLSLGLIFSAKVQAAPSYPIADLGNCASASDCRQYCNVDQNKPACWSYAKYVLQQAVLGDRATNSAEITQKITFPVSELGNCASASECKAYCTQVEHRTACYAFAIKHGLNKQTSESNSQEKGKLLAQARVELGCSDEASCKALCEDPANRGKCMAFARKNGLRAEGKTAGNMAEMVMKGAKEKLGCDSKEACYAFCSKVENMQRCKEFVKSLNPKKDGQEGNSESKPPMMMRPEKRASGAGMTCVTERECYEICKANPTKCPAFERKVLKLVRPTYKVTEPTQSNNMPVVDLPLSQ